MRYKTCEMCEHYFRPTRRDARFCSQACKQKAYRRRADPEMGTVHREKQRQTNIAITKQTKIKTIVCDTCGREFVRTILHTNQIYCTPACKQKAYRQRQAAAHKRADDEYLAFKMRQLHSN